MAESSGKKLADTFHVENQSNSVISLSGFNNAGNIGTDKKALPVIDKLTQRKLLRKLDLRIVPMIMWM